MQRLYKIVAINAMFHLVQYTANFNVSGLEQWVAIRSTDSVVTYT